MPTVTGPDGDLAATIDPDGHPGAITLSLDGRTILEPSPYGLPTPYGEFPADFEYEGREDREIDETYDLIHGKASEGHHRATEATLEYAADAGEAALQVRLASDGLAYRYRIPGSGSRRIGGERTGYVFPQSAVAYLTPYADNHEASARQVPVDAAEGEYCLPGLVRVDGDTWALVGEAAVDGSWAAGRLAAGGGFDLAHPGSINVSLPATSPWRFVVAGDLATAVESTMSTDLVDRSRIDGDWVEPGRVAWSWWSDSGSPADHERQREYVDYAAERGWEYVLVDAGWEPDWLPDLVEYADERGVGVFLWTHYTELANAEKREARLPTWADWGVAGVKIDFMDSDDQGRLGFYDDVMEATAEHGLMVNFHGSVVPTGLSRRFPHVMTYEGAMGAEHLKWSTVSAEHNTILPFARNAVGPMDYTPVAFSTGSRTTTVGHELALAVVFESGLQHLADSIESYGERPLAEAVLEAVPAAWDETRLLGGKPGSEATIARRRGEDWFVGCITAGADGLVEVPLSFLEGEREAAITRDDAAGEELVSETAAVGPDDVVQVPVPENGGFVIRL